MNYKKMLDELYKTFRFHHLEDLYIAGVVNYWLKRKDQKNVENFNSICEIVKKIQRNKYQVEKNLRFYDIDEIIEMVVHYYYELYLEEKSFKLDYDSVLKYLIERVED